MPEPTSPDPAGAGARAAAARLLGRWLQHGTFPDRLMDQATSDRAIVMELVYGVARRRRSLEWVAAQCAERPPAEAVWPFLLVGLYQLLYLDHVPARAAVHATVEALKGTDGAYAAGFVNAVLRRVARDPAAWHTALAGQPLAVRTSHPDALVARWTVRYGADRAAALCAWDNERPRVVLHVNGLRGTPDALLASLRAAGVAAEPHPAGPAWLVLPPGARVPDLPGYDGGLFSVQDPSTGLAVRLLDAQPGERVLDACAAPGGKTALIAEAMQDRGVLVAMDAQAERLVRVAANVKRLGLNAVQTVAADAAAWTLGPGDAPFDRVLLDVPCTNTGVLRRRPDARWRFSRGTLDAQVVSQRRLLDAAAPLVRPGGTLVYSTCSLEPEEGVDQITAWLARHPEFRLRATARTFPPEDAMDGVYAAALERGA